jgi:hypothetical protein
MKTSRIFPIFSILMIIFLLSDVVAQPKFTPHSTEDGLKIEQRWRGSKLFNKNSDAILILKITNTNDYNVEAKISVGFYKDGILVFSAEEQTICLTSGQTIRGFQADLRFTAEEITVLDTRSDNFSWDFASFEVKKKENCD